MLRNINSNTKNEEANSKVCAKSVWGKEQSIGTKQRKGNLLDIIAIEA